MFRKKFTKEQLKEFGYNEDGSAIGEKIDLLSEAEEEIKIEEVLLGIEEKGVETSETLVSFTINQFPTHIAKSNNKVKANKFVKINNQSIYNGTLHHMSRARVIDNLKTFVMEQLQDVPKGLKSKIKTSYRFYTVINHGDIKRIKGETRWKPPKKGYMPSWDIQNLAFVWMKVIDDCLQESGIIKNDNVSYMLGGNYEFVEIDNYEQRKIIVELKKAE
jgi:hypothetical protein